LQAKKHSAQALQAKKHSSQGDALQARSVIADRRIPVASSIYLRV
jgi:hypothetical protein